MKKRESTKKKIINWGPVLTKQEPSDEANINKIVARYFKTGFLPETGKTPRFGDFTGPGFQEMQNTVSDIQQRFLGLPPKIRRRFNNSPGDVIRFLDDPRNRAEAVKLGLLIPVDEDGEPLPAAEPPQPPKTPPVE